MSQQNHSNMNEDEPILNVIDTLRHSVSLVEKWGKSKLPTGETLAEKLTLEGIPFWDMLSVELACTHIPIALSSDTPDGGILCRIRPHLSRSKHVILDLFRSRNNIYGCSTWPLRRSFLCLSFTKHIHRDVLQPVADRLAEHHNCQVVSLSDQPWLNTNPYSHHSHIYQTVWQHWNLQVRDQASKLQKKLYRTAKDLYTSDVLPDIIYDGNRCLWDRLQIVFRSFFRAYLPRLVQQAVIARHILENHSPALVITPDIADPRTRVYTILCQQLGIPSLAVQFGGVGDGGVEWQFLTTDRVAVWGETSKKDMLKHRVPVERIVITGSPRYDCLVNVTEAEVKAKRAMLQVPEKSTMVLLASAYHLKSHDKYSNPEVLRSMKRALFMAADKTPGIILVVKPHPLEDIRETRVLARKSNNVIFVEQQSDIRELTKICDAFISFGSTATVDALVADKLTICPIFPGWAFSDLFKNSGATLVPESDDEIMSIFQMIANGSHYNLKAKFESARQEFINHCVYRSDGMASSRVAELALQIAHSKAR